MEYNELLEGEYTFDEILFIMFKLLIKAKDMDEITDLVRTFKNVLLTLDFSDEQVKSYGKMAVIAMFVNCENRRKVNFENELQDSYDATLTKLIKLSKELGFSNSLELANMYTYLLWNGYLSENHENNFRIEKRLNIPKGYSLDLATGYGVCLNYSDMLTDLLNKDEIPSSIIINKMNKNIKPEYKPDINRSVVKPKLVTRVISKSINSVLKGAGNHACVLTNYNGKLYIYDPTNLVTFKINNKKEASVTTGSGKIILNNLFSYALSKNKNSEDVLDRLNEQKSFIDPFTDDEYIDTWNKCLEILGDSKNLLSDFYSDTKNDLQNISQSAKKLKIDLKKK